MRSLTSRPKPTPGRRRLAATCSAVTLASFTVICASSAGPSRQIAGLSLMGAFVCALWFPHRKRFDAIVPAAGLALAFLILAGLALAAVHTLSTIPVALALTAATLAALWTGPSSPAASPAAHRTRLWLKPPATLAVASLLVFAAAAAVAVHYSSASATADADGASSVSIWAYPSGKQLQIGVEQPAGHGATSLRIVVTQAGVTVATWNDVRLAPGQTWEAPPLTVAGNAPAHVVALRDGTVVASLSSR